MKVVVDIFYVYGGAAGKGLEIGTRDSSPSVEIFLESMAAKEFDIVDTLGATAADMIVVEYRVS